MSDSSHTALRRKVEALQRASSPSATSSASQPDWHSDLSAASQAIQPLAFDPATLRHRADLLRALKSAPHQASIWRDYLNILDNARKAYIRHNPDDASHHISMFQALQNLYERATTVVPMSAANRHSPIYTQLWLDLANLRAEDDPDDANLIFKRLKTHRIGQTLSIFWNAWADLELAQKNHDRAARFRREAAACAGLRPSATPKFDTPVITRERLTDLDMSSSQPRTRDNSRMRPARRALDLQEDLPSTNENTLARKSSDEAQAQTPRNGRLHVSQSTPRFVRPALETASTASQQRNLGLSQSRMNSASRSAFRQNAISPASKLMQSNNSSPELLREQSTPEPEPPSLEAIISPTDRILSQARRKTANEDSPKDVRAKIQREALSHDLTAAVEHRSSQRRWNRPQNSENERNGQLGTLNDFSFEHPSKGDSGRDAFLDGKQTSVRDHANSSRREQKSERKQYRNQDSPSDRPRPGTKEPTRAARPLPHLASQANGLYAFADRPNTDFLHEPDRRGERGRFPEPHEDGAETYLSDSGRCDTGQPPSGRRRKETSSRSPSVQAPFLSQISPEHSKLNLFNASTSRRQNSSQQREGGSSQVLRFLSGIKPESLITVNNRPYLILEQVGKGGSSKVFKVLSREMEVLALKRVKVSIAPQFRKAIDSYANEIALLRKLRGSPAIIELLDADVQREGGTIHMIMEYGDTDLAKILGRRKGERINDNFVRIYWQQMLEAVHTIHEARIIHGDLKPANFLVVRGVLKLIDFGIAKAITSEDTTKVFREAQIGTPNYMSPEALMCDDDESEDGRNHEYDVYKESGDKSNSRTYKVGRASDIWSLGCILYQMVYGRAPFAHIRNTLQKLSCIQDPKYEISYRHVTNANVLEVLQGCLQRNPLKRISIPELVQHRFMSPARDYSRGDRDLSTRGMHNSVDDPRAVLRGFFDILQRCGFEGMLVSGQRVSFDGGDPALEKIINDMMRDAIRLLSGFGCINSTSTGSDITLKGKKDHNGQPWKGVTTPTTSVVTPSATSALASRTHI